MLTASASSIRLGPEIQNEPTVSASSHHHYVPAFDGLRALAIIPVILLHVSVVTLQPGWLRHQLARGWYGVDLFFVLSGFLITWLLTEEMDATGTVALSRFYSRRFLRLGPAYLSTLLVLLVGTALVSPGTLAKVPRVAPALLTYTYNYQLAFGGPHFDLIVVVWSLCVEEQFYLVWPWILRRLGINRALYFCAIAVLSLAMYRVGLYGWYNWGHLTTPAPASGIRIYFSTGTRIGVILVGCMAALSLRHRWTRGLWEWMRQSKLLPYAAAATALVCILWVTGGRPSGASVRSATIGYTIGALAVAGLIVALFIRSNSILARFLSWRPLVALGKVSYGMYLFHLAIAWTVYRLLRPALWSHVASQMSKPSVVGTALPVSKATVVPVSDALHTASTVLTNDSLLKFGVVFVTVTIGAFVMAWLHFQFVERKFMKLRPRVSFRAPIPGRET